MPVISRNVALDGNELDRVAPTPFLRQAAPIQLGAWLSRMSQAKSSGSSHVSGFMGPYATLMRIESQIQPNRSPSGVSAN
jgi:hypothetical protein